MSVVYSIGILIGLVVAQNNIPLPTPSQLAYQRREVVGLTHFNMATFFTDGDPGCDKQNWEGQTGSGNPKVFNPYLLNISNWIESYQAVGAKSAVLTAKHGCGFTLWPSNVNIPNYGIYNYTVRESSYPHDIISMFINNLTKVGIGYGFYYSLTNNYFLNENNHNVQPSNTLIPGQVNVTQSQYEQIAIAQLTELFTMDNLNITEFWFDGGTTGLAKNVSVLIEKYQPTMAIFNGQGVTSNVVRWIGTESGIITSPIWSTGCDSNTGDPNSSLFCPAGCDTTLQNGDHWFYTPGDTIRTLQTLIQVYHDTVGNNGVLELDFAIDTTGNVNATQAQRYKQFGDWINNCYGKSINQTNGNDMILVLNIPNIKFDRVMIQENLEYGQRIRSYEILVNGNRIYSSTAVGHKKIIVFKDQYSTPATVELKIDSHVGDQVYIQKFAAFEPCPSS